MAIAIRDREALGQVALPKSAMASEVVFLRRTAFYCSPRQSIHEKTIQIPLRHSLFSSHLAVNEPNATKDDYRGNDSFSDFILS